MQGGFPQTPRFLPLALASRPPQIMNDLTSSEGKRETLAAGAVALALQTSSEEQRRAAKSPTERAKLPSQLFSSGPAAQCWPAQLARRQVVRPAGWVVPPPAVLPLSSILGLICLAGQVVTSGDNPGQCGRSQTNPISQPNAIPGASVGWWAAASRPGESWALLAMDYFRLLIQDPMCVFPFLAAGWAAGCII